MKKKNLFENTIAFLMLAITIAIITYTHKLVPYMLDDLWYSTNLSLSDMATFDPATAAPIASVSDVWESQVWHYFNWGGRSMTHTILQLTILLGETANNVLNVVFTGLISMIILLVARNLMGSDNGDYANGAKGFGTARSAFYISVIMGMLHGLNASWMMSMYWQSGSANYLYITVFILLFIYCYIRELPEGPLDFRKESKEEATSPKPLKGISFWIVPLAILAGWSNENMGPSAWVLSVFVIWYLRRKNQKVRAWMILGSIFSFAGSAACILAPGNFVRSKMVADANSDKSLVWKLVNRAYSEGRAGVDYLYPALILVILLAIIYYPVLKNRLDTRTVVLFALSVVSWGAMVLSPHYPDRATFGTLALLIVIAVSLMLRLIKAKPELKHWVNAVGVLIWLRGIFWLCEYIGFSLIIIE